MKIYSKTVCAWQPDGSVELLPQECESFDYEGPVIECKSSPSPPPAPDYVGAAQAQGVANVKSAQQTGIISNPNVTNPYGAQTVTWTKDTNKNSPTYGNLVPNITDTLNPQSQDILNNQLAAQNTISGVEGQAGQNVANVMGQPFNQANLPAFPVNPGQTFYNAEMGVLQPQIQQSNEQLTNNLSNQGVNEASNPTAWNNAWQTQNNNTNNLYNQAAAGDVSNNINAYTTALGAQENLYNLPINQVSALMSGAQVQNPTFPSFQGANVAPPNIAGAVAQQGQYNTGLYNAQVGSTNAANTGLFGLGSAAAGAYGNIYPYL